MSNKITATGFSSNKGLPAPEEKAVRGQEYTSWGSKNDYPFFLIDMFNGSAWHQGILNTKTYYIAGGGIEIVSGELQSFLDNQYSDFNMDEVIKACAFDYELFNAFAVIGTWNKEGTRVVRWEHVGVDDVRMNEDESMYFLSDDWTARKQSPEKTNFREISPLNMKNKSGRFIIYYKNATKKSKGELGLYPKPSYNGGLTAINTDYLISRYHLHEIQNGFKIGTLINLANGQPQTQEEAEAIKDSIKGRAQSVEDANEVVITFSDGAENAPTVMSLSGNDLADRYNMTEKAVQQNILVCHSAINPLLFGIKTEGQLGGATELLESYEIFKSLYVQARQESLEWLLHKMAELSGYVGEMKLRESKPINLPETAEPVQEMKQEFRSAEKDLKVFAKYGADRSEFKVVKSISVPNDFGADDVSKMEANNFGMMFDQIGDILINLTDLDKNVLALLRSGEDGASIAGALNEPLMDVAKALDKLTRLNLLVDGATSDLGESVLDRGEVEIDQYEVRYSYEVKPGLGSAVIPTTRDFCKELISMDRMYLREEIQTISNAIGRDVWKYRGGFYNNPTTGRTTPWCRHEWRQHLVRKNTMVQTAPGTQKLNRWQ